MPLPPLPSFTPAERFAIAGIAAIAVLWALPLAGAPDPGPLLGYERARLAAEPWRLLTAHLVHVNGRHVLLNAVVWAVFARLFAPELGAARQAVVFLAAGLAIGIGLASLWPDIAWYRGASGALYGVFFAGAVGWLGRAWTGRAPSAVGPFRNETPAEATLPDTSRERPSARWRHLAVPALLTAGGWAKIIADMPPPGTLPVNTWLAAPVVPQAHLIGAATGTLVAILGWWHDARRVRRGSPKAAGRPA